MGEKRVNGAGDFEFRIADCELDGDRGTRGHGDKETRRLGDKEQWGSCGPENRGDGENDISNYELRNANLKSQRNLKGRFRISNPS